MIDVVYYTKCRYLTSVQKPMNSQFNVTLRIGIKINVTKTKLIKTRIKTITANENKL